MGNLQHPGFYYSRFFFPLRFVLKHLLKGHKHRCNICENNFRKLLSYRKGAHYNARCPVCGSLEATRILWLYISNEILGKRNKNKWLYFTPVSSILSKLKIHDVIPDVAGLEYFNLGYAKNEQKFSGGNYDVILFSHQIQYLNDDNEAFAELKRLLRPGGFVLIQTIINSAMERKYEKIETLEDRDRLKNYFEPGVKSVYGADFHKLLSKAGFLVETVDYAGQLGQSATEYYRLGNGERELIFKCKKP